MQCTCGGAFDLFDAAENGCEACCMRFLAEAGKTRDDVQFDGWHDRRHRTALMVAANYGHAGCVRVLAEKEAGMQDEYRNTALMAAAQKGHPECVKILAPLEKGLKNNDGWTALYFSMLPELSRDCAELLWKHPEERYTFRLAEIRAKLGTSPVSCKEGTCPGASGLVDAVTLGCPQCAEKFLSEAGKRDGRGMSCLMYVAKWGCADLVKVLLEKEKGLRDANGHNARWHAAAECKGILAKAEECSCKDLFEAAESGCEEGCRKFASEAGKTRDGVHIINWADAGARTALMVAAFNGHAGCVRLLADKEAGKRDGIGVTALMSAALKGHLECVKILAPLEKGMADRGGRKAKYYASQLHRQDCCDYLSRFPEEEEAPRAVFYNW